MVWLTALFVGLVEGICRFLPVSVSGHMSILVNLFQLNYARENHLMFDALMHLAAFGAIMAIYGRDLSTVVSEAVAYSRLPVRDRNTERLPQNVRTAAMLAICIAPPLLMVLFSSSVAKLYEKTAFSSALMVLTGLMLWAACQTRDGRRGSKSMSVATAVMIGLGEAVSVMPGLSLFATAYCLAVTSDFRPSNAVRFAYMIMAPIYLVTGVVEVLTSLNAGPDWSAMGMYIVGAAVTFVAGYLTILFFKYILERNKLINVALYMFGIGVITLVLGLFM